MNFNLDKEALEKLNEAANQLNLHVVDDVLKFNNKKLELFPYLLNKYHTLSDIDISFPSSTGRTNKGSLVIYDHKEYKDIGSVILTDNTVKFLVDGFIFEDDQCSQYILDMRNLKNQSKDFSILFDYGSFGKHRLRCAINNSKIFMRMLGQPLGTEQFKFPYFNYTDCKVIKNNETYYQTLNKIENETIRQYQDDYMCKINKLIEFINSNKNCLNNIKTTVDLKNGNVNFDFHVSITPAEQQKMLTYVFNHYNELNNPLFESIIKKAEEFTSNRFQIDVEFKNRDIIKSYLDLTDMSMI